MRITLKKLLGLAILAPALLMLSLGYPDNNAFSTIQLKTKVLSIPEIIANGSVAGPSAANTTGKSGINIAATPNATSLPVPKPNVTKLPATQGPMETPVKKTRVPDAITIPDATPHITATQEPDKTTPMPTLNRTNKSSSQAPNKKTNPDENMTTPIPPSNMTIPDQNISNSSLPAGTLNPDENMTTQIPVSNMTIPDQNISGSSLPAGTLNPDENMTTQIPPSNMTLPETNATTTTNITVPEKENSTTSRPAPLQELNIALVSDMHITDKAQNSRFINTIFETNKIPGIDAMVITGDVVNEPTVKNYETANIILEKLNVSHLLIIGNHDGSESFFKENTGQEPERIEIIKGYQMIFVGFKNDQWSFDFSRANKDLPTIIFVHGPAWGLNGRTCEQTWDELGYACNMGDKLDGFSNLLAVVAGHVHIYSKQETKGVLHLTLDNLDGDSSPANNFIIMKIKNRNASLKQIAI